LIVSVPPPRPDAASAMLIRERLAFCALKPNASSCFARRRHASEFDRRRLGDLEQRARDAPARERRAGAPHRGVLLAIRDSATSGAAIAI
jgi:hypothetical protein